MERLIDIDDKYLRLLHKLLKEHLTNKTVWAYGSRVKWNANPTSDLDLVVWGASNSQATRAIDAFAESNLPFTVQLFIWEDIPDNFKENIRNKYVVLQEEKNILKGWREVKLGDVAKLNSQSIDKSYPYQEILYLDTGSITENKVSDLQLFRIKEAPSRAKRLVKNNDIIYSTVRPIQRHYGFIKKPPKNLVVSTGFSVIETNNKLANPIYIYFVLSSKDVIEELDAIAEGATSVYPSLRPGDIENLQILLPPLSEQKAIAEVLSSLDDKIDLLQRQNKTLEDTAQTLFRKWFIEDADEGWEKKKLGDFFPIVTGKKDANYSTINGKYPFFTCAEDILKAPGYSFEGNAILLAGNGDFNVKRYVGKFEAYQRTYVLIPYEAKYSGFLYALIKFYLHDITSGAQGSVVQFITKGMIDNFKFPVPRQNFDDRLKQLNEIYVKIDSNLSRMSILKTTRNTLLPNLITGKVRVEL